MKYLRVVKGCTRAVQLIKDDVPNELDIFALYEKTAKYRDKRKKNKRI
jgi:hypothetical protein